MPAAALASARADGSRGWTQSAVRPADQKAGSLLLLLSCCESHESVFVGPGLGDASPGR
jgi:hypothetical protein